MQVRTDRASRPSLERPGLYLHVPFCDSICPYCDFAVTIAGAERRAGFVQAIQAEARLAARLEASAGSPRFKAIDTIYLGGGSPSALDAEDLAQILAAVCRDLDVVTDPWITMEINPEHVSLRSAHDWRRLGIRTASLGLQSLDDEVLARLGRRHDAATARRAFEHLREAGLETVSIDLIFGLDGQQPGSWQRQLTAAADLGPDHVSCYQLTIHPGTLLGKAAARGEARLPDEDLQAELYLQAHTLLAQRGLDAYEVSSFASDERHRSVHNLKYWAHTPYLGLGPSAHSFDGARRWWNLRKLRLWQAALERGKGPVDGSERLTPVQLATEAVMLGLRTTSGVDPAAVRHRTGIDIQPCNQHLVAELIERGLLQPDPSRWRPTAAGLAVADGLAALIEVPEATGPG